MKPFTHIRVATAASLLFALSPGAASAADKPNILFIAIDDLNDWIGCLGSHPQVQTPHMDRLAKRGTLFTNAHCQSPLCNPSRTSLLTGLRPSTTGVYALNPWFRTAPAFKDHVTLPQYLAANGYKTLTTGKVYHDAYPPKEDRTNGKEVAVWGHHGGFQPRPAKKFVPTPANIALMDWGVFPERDEQQDDWLVADWAIEQLKSPPKEPFFLAVGVPPPPRPSNATPKMLDL
jgi:arylsulfatase A-like enzyme